LIYALKKIFKNLDIATNNYNKSLNVKIYKTYILDIVTNNYNKSLNVKI